MDINRAFGAPFKDPDWFKKAALGGLWLLIPFVGFAVTGYSIRYMRETANGRETPLPEWNNFGEDWVKGLLAGIAYFIFSLPAVILFAIGALPVVGAIIAGGANGDPEMMASALLAAGGTACLFGGIAFIYLIAMYLLFAAAMAHFAVKGTFGAFFEFSEIMAKLRSGSGYFAAWGWTLLLGFGLGVVSTILTSILSVVPFLGSLIGLYATYVATFLVLVISGHLFGQYISRAYSIVPTYSPAAAAPSYAPPVGHAAPPAPPAYTPPVAPPAPPAPPAEPVAPPAPPAQPAQPIAAPAPPAPPAEPVAPPAPPAPPVVPVAPPAPPAPPVEPPAPAAPPVEPPAQEPPVS